MSGTSTTVNATTVNMTAAPTCAAAVAVEARIAIIAARYSTGGVANARPATNATTNDPHSSRPGSTVGRIRSLCSAVATAPRHHRRSPARARAGVPRSAPRSAPRDTPITTCMCATVGLLTAETTSRRRESAKSRRKSSTTNAAVMPAAMPPSQKTNRLSMGRGREIKSAVIPIRTGSIATNKRQDENCATHRRHLLPNECRRAVPEPSVSASAV